MKESTGELSMVVITIIIIVAVVGIWNTLKPTIAQWVEDTFKKTTEATGAVIVVDDYYNI